jgi:hypothetical protein
VVADFGNDCVTEIHFDEQRLMRRWPIPGVTSVWGSYKTQQEMLITWFAVNPQGLWKQHIEIDADGKQINHLPPEFVVDIPNAFWVRVHDYSVYVLTRQLAIYEYDARTEELHLRRPPSLTGYGSHYSFMAIDDDGAIGPAGRIYWSHVLSKTSIRYLDPRDWSQGSFGSSQLIGGRNRNHQTREPFGHYTWGFAPHSTLPKAVAAGITSSAWFLWSACLGELPVLDPSVSIYSNINWNSGQVDTYLGPGMYWGDGGAGLIGYNVDQFRHYRTWADAREPMRAAMDPLYADPMPEETRETLTRWLFQQRTRPRFWD